MKYMFTSRETPSRRKTNLSFWTKIILGTSVGLTLLAFQWLPWDDIVVGTVTLHPYKRWRVTKDGPGQFVCRLEGERISGEENLRLIQFDRPDLVSMRLAAAVKPGEHIAEGSEVLRFVSADLESELRDLEKEINRARLYIEELRSGAKQAEIEIARVGLEKARERYRNHQTLLERQRALYQQDLIPREDMEQAENIERVLKINLDLAKAKLDAAMSGEKPTMIKRARAELEIFKARLAALQDKSVRLVINTPINGQVNGLLHAKEIVSISETDSLLCMIFLPEYMLAKVKPGMKAEITPFALFDSTYTSRLLRIEPPQVDARGNRYIIAVAAIGNPGYRLAPGMSGEARIYAGRLSAWSWLVRNITLRRF